MAIVIKEPLVDLDKFEECLVQAGSVLATPELLIIKNTLLQMIVRSAWDLAKEVKRYRDGNLTPEEIHNLCHNLKGVSREEFEKGCKEYQDKLFNSCGSI